MSILLSKSLIINQEIFFYFSYLNIFHRNIQLNPVLQNVMTKMNNYNSVYFFPRKVNSVYSGGQKLLISGEDCELAEIVSLLY